MLHSGTKLAALILFVAAASFGIYAYRNHLSAEAQLERERERTAELRQIVHRLETERRIADVIVTDRQIIDGALHTSLLFVEYARDGTPLPAKRFVIEGITAHIDAMVVKFDGKFVEQNDPLRGHSIALFTRLYGEKQPPQSALSIDEPGKIPDVYRGSDPRVAPFEQELWQNFWRLADDAAYRSRLGVRIAQGEGVWRPFEPNNLYTITLESNGGLNIKSEPLKGIYSEALRQHASAR